MSLNMSEAMLFECDKCDKKFTTKFSLNRHLFIHTNEKKFKCRFCTKSFALYQYLREHECIHTNEKPYVCGVNGCEERFRQRGKLSLHRRKHRGYKMKEYNLAKKCEDGTDFVSETHSLLEHTHQRDLHSLNDVSEFEEETKNVAKSGQVKKSRRRKRTRAELNDTDSEFEVPTYSFKTIVKDNLRTSRREKKATFKVKEFLSDEASEEYNGPYKSDSLQENNFESIPDEDPNLNRPNIHISKKQCRKFSNDSTVDAHSIARRHGMIPITNMGIPRKNSNCEKPHSNFLCLVKAFKIIQGLQCANEDCKQFEQTCEENKISDHYKPTSEHEEDKENSDLNAAVRLLKVQNFEGLQRMNSFIGYPLNSQTFKANCNTL